MAETDKILLLLRINTLTKNNVKNVKYGNNEVQTIHETNRKRTRLFDKTGTGHSNTAVTTFWRMFLEFVETISEIKIMLHAC